MKQRTSNNNLFLFSCTRLVTEFPEHSFYNPSSVGLPMVMTAYHWRKLPELIGNSRVQAEVRLTFTLKSCKHAKKQMIKIASIFLF